MTRMTGPDCVVMCNLINTYIHTYIHTYILPNERFNDCGERGYDDSVPGEVTKKKPSGDRTT